MKRAEVAQAVRKHHPLDVFHFVSRLPKMARLYLGLMRDPRVSIAVDGGVGYGELRGAELLGRVAVVGDVPRTDQPHPATAAPEQLWGDKYTGGTFRPDGKHAWLRLEPDKVVSWDFRKLGDL